MRYLVLGLVFIASLFFLVLHDMSAGAQLRQNKCDLRDHIVAELNGAYREKIVAHGVGLDNAVMEILISESGSWTILRTQIFPSGSKWSCIIYAGRSWELRQLKLGTNES